MGRARAAAAPAALLLLLCCLGRADPPARPAAEPGSDAQVPVLSKNKIKSMIKLLNHRICVLQQKRMMHEPKLSEKQDEVLSAPVNLTDVKVAGPSVKTQLIPNGVQIDVQEMPSPNIVLTRAAQASNTSSVLIINKLQKIFPNILLDTQAKYKQVDNEKKEEGKKKRMLFPDLKQDKNTDNKDRLTRTNITIRFHSKDNSSQTQIDIYNLKNSQVNPEVHIVASNIIDKQSKINSVVVQDDILQVSVNNSLDKKTQDNEKVRRKSLAKIEAGSVERNFTDSNRKKLLISDLTANSMKKTSHSAFSEEIYPAQSKPTDVPESVTYPQRQLTHILEMLEDQMGIQRYDFPVIKGSNSKVSMRMLKSVLQDLEKEYKTQMPLSVSESVNSSVMENILQNLKKNKEKSESSEKENKTQTPFEGHSRSSQVSDENTEEFTATPVPVEPASVTKKANMNNAKRFEFFKEHEGIHDKKKAKTADLKGLLKHIIIACVAVTGLILAVIVLMHIFTSIFAKNKQEPVITNTYNIYKRGDPTNDEAKSIPEIDCEELKRDVTIVKNQSPPGYLSTEEAKKSGKDLEPVGKQPANNLSSPSKRADERHTVLSTTTQPSKCSHCSQMLPVNCLSSETKTCKNHRTRPRTLKANQACCHKPRHHCTKSKEHGYKRLRDKDLTLHRKHLNHQRSPRHDKHRSRSRSKKCNASHSNCSFLDRCSDSSPSDDSSSDVFISSDTTAKTHLSEISQHDGSKCTCSQHRMDSCNSDSYSD